MLINIHLYNEESLKEEKPRNSSYTLTISKNVLIVFVYLSLNAMKTASALKCDSHPIYLLTYLLIALSHFETEMVLAILELSI